MEISNYELSELRDGLVKLQSLKASPDDPPEKKAALLIIANRVGHALRQLWNALDAFDDLNNAMIMHHAKKDSEGRPIPVLDDRGGRSGFEIADFHAFSAERKPLLRERVMIPELKPITYELLAQVGYPLSGDLVAQLGDFLTGEPKALPASQEVAT